jgi:hypothetical protein
MRAFSIYFGRTRSSRRNHPRTQSVPEVSGENNSPRIPILFCATSDGPIASAPCTAVAWAPPHRTHLLSLSWRHASEPWLPAAVLCRPQPWPTTACPPPLQGIIVFSHLPRARELRSTSATKFSPDHRRPTGIPPVPRTLAGRPLLRTPPSKCAASATTRLNCCCWKASSNVWFHSEYRMHVSFYVYVCSDISLSLLRFHQAMGTELYVFVLMSQRTSRLTLLWPMSTVGVCISLIWWHCPSTIRPCLMKI